MLDEQSFTLEQLNSLRESLPTDDESKTLKAYGGDISRLGAVREGGGCWGWWVDR